MTDTNRSSDQQVSDDPLCRCGHGIEEHPLGGNCCGGDADCWCKAYEPEEDDEWDGDEDFDPYEAAGESRFSLPGGGKSL